MGPVQIDRRLAANALPTFYDVARTAALLADCKDDSVESVEHVKLGAPARILVRCGDWAQAHGWILFAALLLTYLCAALGYSLGLPLWHDELFTFHIAQTPTVRDLIHETRTLDLNPPLSYLLTRASFRLFGIGTLQCRLPEIAGFVLALTGVFAFARRRAGDAYGLLAVVLLLSSDAAQLSIQARPYGLLLGFTALALASWQIADDLPTGAKGVLWANLALFGSLVALLLTHVFGVFAWAVIVAGEAASSYKRRHINVPRLLAAILPIGLAVLYRPLLRNHGASAFPLAFQPKLQTVLLFYRDQLGVALLCLLCACVLVGLASRGVWLRGSARYRLTGPECIALSGLVIFPLVLIAHLRLNHGAFYDRYGVAANIGFSLLLTFSLCWLAEGRPAVAVVAAILLLQCSGRLPDAMRSLKHWQIFRWTEPFVPASDLQSLMAPGLPLVDASGLTFVEMNQRAPANLLDRVYYLDDPAAALQYAHATIFNQMTQEAEQFHFRGRVETYARFIAVHPRFYVLGTYAYPEDWLLRKLQADGMQLRLLGPVKAFYKDQELYEVTAPSSPAGHK